MNDLISRQMAIEVVQNRHMMLSKEKVLLINDLENLPSVQPYTIHSDGRLWITVDDIDKVTAVVVDEHKSKFCKQFYEDYEDAQPKRGKWIKTARWGRVYYCDQCRNYLDFDGVNAGRGSTNFCPNCGADMREDGENSEIN